MNQVYFSKARNVWVAERTYKHKGKTKRSMLSFDTEEEALVKAGEWND